MGLPTPRALFASFATSALADERLRWIVYGACFLAIFGGLEYGYQLVWDTPAERFLIETLTVAPAAALTNAVTPGLHVTAEGNVLHSLAGDITVLPGCDGTEGIFLLVAAVLPFPTSWRRRLAAAGIGILVMYGLNLLRFVALMLTLELDPSRFEAMHLLILPTFIVTCGCAFVFVWMEGGKRHAA